MTKLTLMKDCGLFYPVEFTEGDGALSIKLGDNEQGARLSLGTSFTTVKGEYASLVTTELEDGEYTLFIHKGGLSQAIMRLSYRGGTLKPIVGADELFELNKTAVLQAKLIRRLEVRIGELEKAVFSPLLF